MSDWEKTLDKHGLMIKEKLSMDQTFQHETIQIQLSEFRGKKFEGCRLLIGGDSKLNGSNL